MWKSQLLNVVSAAWIVAAVAMAQVINPYPEHEADAHEKQIASNTRRIKFELSLDRETYLYGEVIRPSLSAWNPTNDALEVLDPAKLTGIDLYQWGDQRQRGFEDWEPVNPKPLPVQFRGAVRTCS